MRILRTGANGQAGNALRHSLAPLGEVGCATRDGRLATAGSRCEMADLGRPAELAGVVQRIAPDVLVNAAAYTAVDRAESERDAAYRINAEAVDALATACAARNALLVHYSTDYVFPGDDPRPRREDDPIGPINVYGASKLAGEEAIRASGCRHLLFRTSWVYAARGHNFLRTMLRLANEEELRVVDDQTGAPTPAAWVARTTAEAIEKRGDRSGTWHVAAAGETTWHGFAEAIFAEALRVGLITRAPRVVAVPARDYPTPARRPASSRLDTSRLKRDFGISLPGWRQGLTEAIATLAESSARGSAKGA